VTCPAGGAIEPDESGHTGCVDALGSMEIERDALALDKRQHPLEEEPFVVPYQFSESAFCEVRSWCAANSSSHDPSS